MGIPVTVEHSLKATALAAARLPENRDAQDLLFILVGRGVGMAILANGEIYPGSTNLPAKSATFLPLITESGVSVTHRLFGNCSR